MSEGKPISSLNAMFKPQIPMFFSCRGEERGPPSHSKLQDEIISSVVGRSAIKTGQDKSSQAGSLARKRQTQPLGLRALRVRRRAHAARTEESPNPPGHSSASQHPSESGKWLHWRGQRGLGAFLLHSKEVSSECGVESKFSILLEN